MLLEPVCAQQIHGGQRTAPCAGPHGPPCLRQALTLFVTVCARLTALWAPIHFAISASYTGVGVAGIYRHGNLNSDPREFVLSASLTESP